MDFDTLQEAGGRGLEAIGPKAKADFYVGSQGDVIPINEGAKRFIDGANSGVGLKQGDMGIIVRDAAANPDAHHTGHTQPMDGGTAISIHPK